MDENSKNVKLEISPSVDNAVKNLTDKPTQNMGKTLADIWYLVFSPISYRAEKKKIKYDLLLNEYHKELESSISNIPPEKRIDPSLQITAQALENSKYCIEEKELRKMFTSLISNSMNKDYSTFIHPSFAEIIKQMSALDAQILQLINQSKIGLPICQYLLWSQNDPPAAVTFPDYIFLDLPDVDFLLCSRSISSLLRLGLISAPCNAPYIPGKSNFFDLPDRYKKFLEFTLFKNLAPDKDHVAGIKMGMVQLTPLGYSFAKVCISD